MADESFKDFVMDQLAAVPELRLKAMFGGYGLYQGGRFFGILMAGRLYFKTDGQSRGEYVKRAMSPFIYEKAKRTTTIHYYEVPAEVLEDRQELVRWAARASEAASHASRAAINRLEANPVFPEALRRGRRRLRRRV